MRSNKHLRLARFTALASGVAALLPAAWAKPVQAAEAPQDPPAAREAPQPQDEDERGGPGRDDRGPRRQPHGGPFGRGQREGGREFGPPPGRPGADQDDREPMNGRGGRPAWGREEFQGRPGRPQEDRDEDRGPGRPERGRKEFNGRPGQPQGEREFRGPEGRGPGRDEFAGRRGREREDFDEDRRGPDREGRRDFEGRGPDHRRGGEDREFAGRDREDDDCGPGRPMRGERRDDRRDERRADAGQFAPGPRDFTSQAGPNSPVSSEPVTVTGQVLRVDGDGSVLLRSGNETLRVSSSTGRLPSGTAPGKQMRLYGVRNGSTFFATNSRVLN